MLSREAQDAELLSGRLDAARLTKIPETLVPAGDVDEWFLCGPFEMVVDLREALLEQGVDKQHDPRRAVPRRAGAARPRTPSPAERRARAPRSRSPSTAAARRSGSPATTSSVLDAALRVRADAPFACKGGVCGTCRAKVLEGEVEMDTNYALEPDEVERGLRADLPVPPDHRPRRPRLRRLRTRRILTLETAWRYLSADVLSVGDARLSDMSSDPP